MKVIIKNPKVINRIRKKNRELYQIKTTLEKCRAESQKNQQLRNKASSIILRTNNLLNDHDFMKIVNKNTLSECIAWSYIGQVYALNNYAFDERTSCYDMLRDLKTACDHAEKYLSLEEK